MSVVYINDIFHISAGSVIKSLRLAHKIDDIRGLCASKLSIPNCSTKVYLIIFNHSFTSRVSRYNRLYPSP